jgi:hypothetical protein
VSIIAVALYFYSGANPLALLFPLLYTFGFVPLADRIFGEALRDFSDLPRLPSGYPGCFGLAAIPPLWFRVMNPKLMQWAGGDITKVNIDPASKDQLYAKYGAAR